MIKRIYQSNKRSLALSLILGLAGWLYWYFIGCSSGTCAITSSPLNSTLYGSTMGFILGIQNNQK